LNTQTAEALSLIDSADSPLHTPSIPMPVRIQLRPT